MTRRTRVLDRLLVFVTGALFVAAGVAAVLWSRGDLFAGASPDLGVLVDDVGQWWWTAACGGVGLLLTAGGLWWLSVHRRSPGVRRISLTGGGDAGDASADVAAVASAAADVLENTPAVVKATARASVESGVPTVTLTATVPARRGLSAAVEAVDETVATAAAMLGAGVAFRTRVRIDRRRRHSPVV